MNETAVDLEALSGGLFDVPALWVGSYSSVSLLVLLSALGMTSASSLTKKPLIHWRAEEGGGWSANGATAPGIHGRGASKE